VDVEQYAAELDADGDDFHTPREFKIFLRKLARYGAFPERDVLLTTKYFTDTHSKETIHSSMTKGNGMISLREVMAFLGKTYIGNLEARLKRLVREKLLLEGRHIMNHHQKENQLKKDDQSITNNHNNDSDMITILRFGTNYFYQLLCDHNRLLKQQQLVRNQPIKPDQTIQIFIYEDIETVFDNLQLYQHFSHDQLRKLLLKFPVTSVGSMNGISVNHLMNFFELPFQLKTTNEIKLNDIKQSHLPEKLDAEYLLRLLLERVQMNGIAVDEVN
jgi:hypothetical protein